MGRQHRSDKQRRLKASLEALYDVPHDHPRADTLFDLAWSYGHASDDTSLYYGELAELLPTVGIDSSREATVIRAALRHLEHDLTELNSTKGPLLDDGLANAMLERHEILALLEKLSGA